MTLQLESRSLAPRDRQSPAPLTALETEVIDFFVHLARLLGLPKSVAEIYGLLFLSLQPLSMDQIMGRLSVSKGSASQGLKFLRNLGAVQTVYAAGSRCDHFKAETELRRLAGGFLSKQLGPHFESSLERLERIERGLAQVPESERGELGMRVRKLRQWEKRGRQLAPVLAKLLG
ncbi:MAG: hypothetical protein WCO56_08045 [Verrucomicrobiota bacterium]